MRSSTSEPTQALLARFREIVEVEDGRCRAADQAVEEIEKALRAARDTQRVAVERRAEAATAYETAATYATAQDLQAQGPAPGGASTEGAAPFGEGATSGRAVLHLIVDVLEVGQITPLATIDRDPSCGVADQSSVVLVVSGSAGALSGSSAG